MKRKLTSQYLGSEIAADKLCFNNDFYSQENSTHRSLGEYTELNKWKSIRTGGEIYVRRNYYCR